MKTLVLGATTKEDRYAHIVTKRLLKYGNEVVLVGKDSGVIEGNVIQNTMENIKDIDTVTMYLSSKNQANYEKQILALHPRRVIFNPGAENPALSEALQENDIEVLDACTLVMLSTGQF